MSWYRIDPSVRDGDDQADPYAAAIAQEEVFRNRQLTPQDNPTIFTFDLAYCPDERGPYNFDLPNGTPYSAGVENVGGKVKLKKPLTAPAASKDQKLCYGLPRLPSLACLPWTA